MKKCIVMVVALLLVLPAGLAFAERHWVSLEYIGRVGIGLRYEGVITPSFTLGAYFSAVGSLVSASHCVTVGGGATGRWYPTARRFFTELSLGLGEFYNVLESHVNYGPGLTITPGIGWTIDVGKPGGFFIATGARLPIFCAGSDVSVEPYFGVGWAF